MYRKNTEKIYELEHVMKAKPERYTLEKIDLDVMTCAGTYRFKGYNPKNNNIVRKSIRKKYYVNDWDLMQYKRELIEKADI